jgi:hypothetical protein
VKHEPCEQLRACSPRGENLRSAWFHYQAFDFKLV